MAGEVEAPPRPQWWWGGYTLEFLDDDLPEEQPLLCGTREECLRVMYLTMPPFDYVGTRQLVRVHITVAPFQREDE